MTHLLVTSSYPPRLGGVESYLGTLASVLQRLGGVTILAPDAPGARAVDEAAPAETLRYRSDIASISRLAAPGVLASSRRALANAGGARPDPRAWRSLWPRALVNPAATRRSALQLRALRSPGARPDLVHAGSALPSGLTAAVVSAATGAPYVVFAHGAELLRFGGHRRVRPLLGRVLAGALRVACVSAFTADLVRDLGVSDARISSVPPGIDPAPFAGGADPEPLRARFGLGARRVVLTHGRLDPRKGHDVVIEALPSILARCPDAVYLVTGEGETAPALAARARELGLEGSVVLAGRIAAADVPAVYALADVFVMASRREGANVEGFGIVCLEAAAAGVPVVAGRSGGVPDAVAEGQSGLLVDPTSPSEVAEAIAGLLEDPARSRRMGAVGRARVRAKFDLEAFERRVSSLVAGARGGAAVSGAGRRAPRDG